MVSASLDYYDRILVGIALLIGVGLAAGLVTPLSYHQGLASGSVAATLLVYHTLFRNPPVAERDVRYGTAVVLWHAYLIGILFPLL